MEIRLFFNLKVDTKSWIKYNATPKSSKKLLNNPVPERGNYGVGVNNLNTIELDVRYCVWWLGKLPRVNIFIWNLCKSQPSLELQRKRRYWSHIRGRRKLHKIHDIANPVGNQKSELQQILFEDFVGGLWNWSFIGREPVLIINYTMPGSSIKQPTLNWESTLCRVKLSVFSCSSR